MRIHAWRRDLADIDLAASIFAPHYARPLPRACGARPAMIRRAPGSDVEALSELLPGECFAVLEYATGWAWGFAQADHVVGYVEGIALGDPFVPTHLVCEREAQVAAEAAPDAPIVASLPMGSRLSGRETGGWLASEYGCVKLEQLRRIDAPELDPAAVAERLIGAPFLAGGRTAAGVDEAGLVQLALSLCGIAAPRLLDQLQCIGEATAEGAPAQRGDLVLFAGGAGLMVDERLMIYAGNAAGKVVVEPIASYAVERRRLTA